MAECGDGCAVTIRASTKVEVVEPPASGSSDTSPDSPISLGVSSGEKSRAKSRASSDTTGLNEAATGAPGVAGLAEPELPSALCRPPPRAHAENLASLSIRTPSASSAVAAAGVRMSIVLEASILKPRDDGDASAGSGSAADDRERLRLAASSTAPAAARCEAERLASSAGSNRYTGTALPAAIDAADRHEGSASQTPSTSASSDSSPEKPAAASNAGRSYRSASTDATSRRSEESAPASHHSSSFESGGGSPVSPALAIGVTVSGLRVAAGRHGSALKLRRKAAAEPGPGLLDSSPECTPPTPLTGDDYGSPFATGAGAGSRGGAAAVTPMPSSSGGAGVTADHQPAQGRAAAAASSRQGGGPSAAGVAAPSAAGAAGVAPGRGIGAAGGVYSANSSALRSHLARLGLQGGAVLGFSLLQCGTAAAAAGAGGLLGGSSAEGGGGGFEGFDEDDGDEEGGGGLLGAALGLTPKRTDAPDSVLAPSAAPASGSNAKSSRASTS